MMKLVSASQPVAQPRLDGLTRQWDTVLLAVILLPLLWPLIAHNLPNSADGALHVLRLLVLDGYLRQGQMLPRWAPDLVGGFGYPVFSFYSPASYYLAEVPRLLGFDAFTSVAIAFAVILVGAALGMRALVRALLTTGLDDEVARWTGLVGAAAYGYAPYLLQNVYMRSAIGEAAAQALLPWILWAFCQLAIAPHPKRYIIPAAVLLAGLALTHNITLILFPPLLVAYVIWLWWRNGRSRSRAIGLVAAGLLAIGLSAFFWAPLITERGFLSNYAYELSINLLIPENIWNWNTFLDGGLVFHYSLGIPYKIGLFQLGLALAGATQLIRRSRSWWFWVLAALSYGLVAGKWAEPLWLSNDILLVMQFPWRVLSVISVVLALLAAGLIAYSRSVDGRASALGVLTVIAIVIFQAPRVTEPPLAPPTASTLMPSAVNTFEESTGSWGTSSAHEFIPRWVKQLALEPEPVGVDQGPESVAVVAASLWSTTLQVQSKSPAALRLTDFYFPGWMATTETGESLALRPTTSLGLLTIDIPAGTHTITVAWGSTPVRHWAEWLSLATLAGLFVWGASQTRRDVWLGAGAGSLTPLLVMSVVGQMSIGGTPFKVAGLDIAVVTDRLDLVGLGTEQPRADVLLLHPYWYARAPLEDRLFTWLLQDSAGRAVARIESRPVYGSRRATDWPAGTLIDDRYQLGLPGGLSAGTYDLVLQSAAVGQSNAGTTPAMVVGQVTLHANPGPAPETHEPIARFSDRLELSQGTLSINDRPVNLSSAAWIVAYAGDQMRLDLPWRPLRGLYGSLKSYAHLVYGGASVAKSDQTPGTSYSPISLWNLDQWSHDIHTLTVATELTGGAYEMIVGLYRIKAPNDTNLEIWPLTTTDYPRRTDAIVLFRVKVLGPPEINRALPLARFDDFADLIGVEVVPTAAALGPGSTVIVRLTYRAHGGAPADLTQFVHLVNADGLIGQIDAPPLDNRNPTSSWQPGEIIHEELTFAVSADAHSGPAQLTLGFYNPANGERAVATLPDGTQSQDRSVLLGAFEIAP